MERPLTVLLPVHNAQSTLAVTVPDILDVLAELTQQFEMVIIDDGSTDATSEVAQELTYRYPQVRCVSYGSPLGCEAALRLGLPQSHGNVILLRHENARAEVEEIRRLWGQAAKQSGAASGREDNARLRGPHAGSRQPAHQPGHQTIDRGTIRPARGRSPLARPNYLRKLRDFALGE